MPHMTFFKGSKKIANRHGLSPSKAPPENRFAENERFGSYRAGSTGPNSSANKSVQRLMNDTIIIMFYMQDSRNAGGRHDLLFRLIFLIFRFTITIFIRRLFEIRIFASRRFGARIFFETPDKSTFNPGATAGTAP